MGSAPRPTYFAAHQTFSPVAAPHAQATRTRNAVYPSPGVAVLTQHMEDSQKAEIKARGVLLATGGLATALLLMLGMSALDLTILSYQDWLWAAGGTAFVQGILLLVAWRGLDRFVPGDPHFLYVPLVGALLLLGLYTYLAPELRFLILLGWFVALLFMAGLGGLRSVVSLSALMCAAYFLVSVIVDRRGYPLSLGFEAAITGSVFIISVYAGFVFERLRADRIEMKQLRERLSEMALTDALTQLPNRRHFMDVLNAELDRVRRYGGRCSVAMVDVDLFKHYNDTLGHLAGDTVLQELADVMRRELRLHDMVARYGGEEFALLMINTGKTHALAVLERLRVDVQEYPFRHRDIQPAGRLTVSAGLASFPEDGSTYEELMRKADDALYEAKRSGRNQIALASQPAPDMAR